MTTNEKIATACLIFYTVNSTMTGATETLRRLDNTPDGKKELARLFKIASDSSHAMKEGIELLRSAMSDIDKSKKQNHATDSETITVLWKNLNALAVMVDEICSAAARAMMLYGNNYPQG